MLFSLPCSLYALGNTLRLQLSEWVSWDHTHSAFERVDVVSGHMMKLQPALWISLNVTRYSLVACGFFFFLFFGLTGEAGTFYKSKFWACVKPLGWEPKVSVNSFGYVTSPPFLSSYPDEFLFCRSGRPTTSSGNVPTQSMSAYTGNASFPRRPYPSRGSRPQRGQHTSSLSSDSSIDMDFNDLASISDANEKGSIHSSMVPPTLPDTTPRSMTPKPGHGTLEVPSHVV